MSKDSRSGGKYTGSHTTCIPLAAQVCDIVHKIPEVSKIIIGYITAGLRSVGGKKRVKITDERRGCLLLSVRDSTSLQEIRVYTSHSVNTQTKITSHLEAIGLEVNTQKR